MNQDIVDDAWKESSDGDMIFRDAIMQRSLVNSSCPKHYTPMNWSIKEQQLQELRNSLRMELYFNPNQKWTDILATCDPHYRQLLERIAFMLRTQTLTTLAYREALQQIQDEESSFITHMKRKIDHTNILPLEIHVGEDDTRDKGRSKNTCKDETKNNRGQRDPTHTFPSILHEILSNPEYSDIVTWLPHGRAWRIIRRTKFERLVIPRYFRHGRYSSFMRQVNGWGFQRITAGPDHNAYHHELFKKDSPQLCCIMRRPTSSDTTKSQIAISCFHEMHRHRDYKDRLNP